MIEQMTRRARQNLNPVSWAALWEILHTVLDIKEICLLVSEKKIMSLSNVSVRQQMTQGK